MLVAEKEYCSASCWDAMTAVRKAEKTAWRVWRMEEMKVLQTDLGMAALKVSWKVC